MEDTLLYVDTKTVDVLTKESPRVLAGGSVDVDSGESPFGLACLLVLVVSYHDYGLSDYVTPFHSHQTLQQPLHYLSQTRKRFWWK